MIHDIASPIRATATIATMTARPASVADQRRPGMGFDLVDLKWILAGQGVTLGLVAATVSGRCLPLSPGQGLGG